MKPTKLKKVKRALNKNLTLMELTHEINLSTGELSEMINQAKLPKLIEEIMRAKIFRISFALGIITETAHSLNKKIGE